MSINNKHPEIMVDFGRNIQLIYYALDLMQKGN